MATRSSRLSRIVKAALVLALLAGARASSSRADEPFALKGGERIVFFGDSITQAGLYAQYVEAFLRTRFPDRRVTIINHGISSETLSGTSEPDHTPPRPHALKRLRRDVVDWKPDVVVACFGMNDGNYYPFEPERFGKFKDGVKELISGVRRDTKAQLYLLTPPAFDPYQRRVGDPGARHYGYRFPAIDYDQTLEKYGAWLMKLDESGVRTVDVHSAFNEHLRKRREGQVSYYLSGDAVHPNQMGHWLMAQSLLLAWHAPSLCDEAKIDASAGKATAGTVRDISSKSDELSATWRSSIPMPIDPAWDERSTEIERVSERLNRYRLTVTGLSRPKYRLLAGLAGAEDETRVAELSRDALAEGVDLTALPRFPTNVASLKVLSLIQGYQQANYAAWRKRIADGNSGGEPSQGTEDDQVVASIRKLCQPTEVKIRLVPAD